MMAIAMDPCPDENTLSDAAHGLLSPGEQPGMERHLDECPSCRIILAELLAAGRTAPAQGSGPPEWGTIVGRYVLLKLLGAGGMGLVYEAYDPELDRRVALKLHAPRPGLSDGAVAQARLFQEAQALARLSHENVITVHDVGVAGDRVYLAMELIDGASVRSGQDERPRTWREVLKVYRAAGTGLAAAHGAGLLHRDIKPDNILRARAGRVVITDFGLARAEHLGTPVPGTEEVADHLTLTGALLGTPAYMAPEQLRGEAATEQSEIFSFSVALYEALYGERPYAAATLNELRREAEAGRVRPPPRRVPLWLRRILLRGLAPDPAARFPSMGALLAALSVDPWVPWRRRALFGGGVVLATLCLLGWHERRERPMRACRAEERRLVGVWDVSRREALRQALSRAPSAFREIAAALDTYGAAYVREATEACLAARVRGEQSEGARARRMACLDRRLHELRAYTSLFARAGEIDPARQAGAARALSGIAWCGGAEVLRGQPLDAGDARSAGLRAQLAEAKVLLDAGEHRRALALAEMALPEARRFGPQPLLAEALLILGSALLAASDPSRAEAMLKEAEWHAKSTGHDEVAAWAWVKLVAAVQAQPGREADVLLWRRFAAAALERLGGDRDDLSKIALPSP